MNVTALKKIDNLNVGVKLFLTLISLCAPDGTVTITKTALAKYLKTSRQTVGAYLTEFAESGILKYKYSGSIRFNPEFYYIGDGAERDKAFEEYKNFKSDV